MFRRFSVNFALFSIVLDGLIIAFALTIATYIRPALGFLPFTAEYPGIISTPSLIYLVFVVEWIVIFFQFHVYDGRKNLRPVDVFVNITLGSLLAAVAMAGTLYLSYRMVSRLLFLVFILLGYTAMLSWRALFWMDWHKRIQHVEKHRRVIIVGAGMLGRQLAEQIAKTPHLDLKVVGFLDDDRAKQASCADVLGSISDVKMAVEKWDIQDVVITLPPVAYDRMSWLVGELHQLPVKVWVIPDYFRLALHKAAVEEFGGIVMLDLRAPALSDSQRLAKRAFDMVVIVLFLPFALIIGAILYLAIWITTGKPVLFCQERVGENGKLFKMWKFRSMVPEADAMRHLVEGYDSHGKLIHKRLDDPRVTKIGRFIRRTSLDELPQLWNVIKGEMSLVGPRPELPYLVAEYEPWQRQRFVVPQGITGWWQISGRSDRPMHLNTEDDLYYVQNYSLLLDIYILIKTLGVVIMGRGAF